MPLTEGQGSLQGVTFGVGTKRHISPQYVTGIGVQPPKNQDTTLDHGDGGYGGVDRKGVRSIVIPYTIVGTSAADAMDEFETLAAAWEPVSADVTLELYLPGKHFTVQGRPRGLPENLSRQKSGIITAVGLFVCLNPTLTAV